MTSDRPGSAPDRLIAGDCLESFPGVEAGSIDLVFADPPFNIGYDYDVYDDRRDADALPRLVAAVDRRRSYRVLKPTARSGWRSATSTRPS